ncbi:MAG TPA: sulfatase [Capsulimonadaceae bacterium]
MFDSLNRHMLPPYGSDEVQAPNFVRLAERSATFDTSYVCSMPCMPARRDLHTGRPHFLHRGWGPIEPFDDSMPSLLHDAGVYTHLVTDHYHYFEDGGATYHNRYSSWEFMRGQEGDRWFGQVRDPQYPDGVGRLQNPNAQIRQDQLNRAQMPREEDMPQTRTFQAGIDFMRRNASDDNWMLQIETFDPHEPFFAGKAYKDMYPEDYMGPQFDWPNYTKVSETDEQVAHCRHEYKALVSMCDANLGRVIDAFDELNLWDDTMLIVWTDHGFLLGEHGWWAKMRMPWYEELARTPFFVWDPRSKVQNERRASLVQPAIDIAPTLLEYFGVAQSPDMLGKSLAPVIASDAPTRDAALFGVFGAQVNVTDGRYVYMRATADPAVQIHEHTLMPAYMTALFSPEQLRNSTLSPPLSFTKGCPVLRVPVDAAWLDGDTGKTLLFDLEADPRQANLVTDPAIEARMIAKLIALMQECDAPREQYERLGLDKGTR